MSRNARRLLALVAALTALAARAAAEEAPLDPLRRIRAEEAARTPGILDANDPLESVNRRIYVFNARFDRYVFLPAVRGYEFVLPGFARTGISNVFALIDDATTFANSVLQLAPKKAAGTLGRVAVNLTVGVAGLWDAATRLGLPHHQEDFGQTLGHYGLPAGPYLVVPVLGPSSVRDGTGMLVDRAPFAILNVPPWWVTPVEGVSTRADNPFRYGDIGPPFEYDLVRWLYLEHRKLLVAH
ncbi:MAG: VacJ family lipoprotein [Deltaproteobacteria bacterium]|nr:MAG: VacJ family lipoprotein [Deltaproteobacteria bacterium]